MKVGDLSHLVAEMEDAHDQARKEWEEGMPKWVRSRREREADS